MYQREIIPATEENYDDISEVGFFKLVAVNQEDGYGPHQDAVYLRDISEEFRWWDCILFNQPP